jgi:hypothetical protein
MNSNSGLVRTVKSKSYTCYGFMNSNSGLVRTVKSKSYTRAMAL